MEMQGSSDVFAGGEPILGNRRAVAATWLVQVALGAFHSALATHAICLDPLDGGSSG